MVMMQYVFDGVSASGCGHGGSRQQVLAAL
jgi:hypothetical protein